MGEGNERIPPAATMGSHHRKGSKLEPFWKDTSDCLGRMDWKGPKCSAEAPGGGWDIALASVWGSGFRREGEDQ